MRKLRFESNSLNTDILAYSQSSQGDTGVTISYFIDKKQIAKKAFDAFANEQYGKKDAAWYEFSQENIETKLAANS